MTGTKLLTFARRNSIALLALFIALGGTGYAAVQINGKDIKPGTVTGKALKHNTLTGKQIKESKLGRVPSADSATKALDADALGGAPAAGFQKTGCVPGRVNGYAQINGSAASFPATFTSAAPFITDAYNCSGQAVQVKRTAAGIYFVRFPGNPGTLAVANAENCVPTDAVLCLSAIQREVSITPTTTGMDAGAGTFGVISQTSGSASPIDVRFDVLVP